MTRGVVLAAILFSVPAAAETVNIRAGRLIDPDTECVLSDQRIRIVDGKIAAVTPWRDGDGAVAIDWSGKTVLPGLIDVHTHIADGSAQGSDPAEPLKNGEAAKALKMEGQVGTLRPGAWGDLIAVEGDPLRDVRVLEQVAGVMKSGKLQK